MSLSDPSGLRPTCDGCSQEEYEEIVGAWAQAQTQAAASDTGAYDPGRVGEPAPPVLRMGLDVRPPDAHHRHTWIWYGPRMWVTTVQTSFFVDASTVTATPVDGATSLTAGFAGWRLAAPGWEGAELAVEATMVFPRGVRVPMDPVAVRGDVLRDPRWTDLFEFEATVPTTRRLPLEVVFTIRSRAWAAEGQAVSFLSAWYRIRLARAER